MLFNRKASSPYHYAKTAVYRCGRNFICHSLNFLCLQKRPGLPFFASNYLMELLPNWLCWGCKASAFYHHTRTRLGRGRGGYVHVRFFQYSSGSIKSHFINHSTFFAYTVLENVWGCNYLFKFLCSYFMKSRRYLKNNLFHTVNA